MTYHCNKCNQQRMQGCFAKGCPGMPRHDGDWQLPPLPAPDRTMWQYGKQLDHYTASQMKEYARAAAGLAQQSAFSQCLNVVMLELDGNGQARAIAAAIEPIQAAQGQLPTP